ncbi:MAG: prepilin-type N-terminal cleavage/methylation domain-containing protein [Magnetococcus sp. WYHC-3]
MKMPVAVSNSRSEGGFSLVEIAIVLVIIALIVTAVAVGRDTMQQADTLKAYQRYVVPVLSHTVNFLNRAGAAGTINSTVWGNETKIYGDGGNATSFTYEDGRKLDATMGAAGKENQIKFGNVTSDLQQIMSSYLDGSDYTVGNWTANATNVTIRMPRFNATAAP